MGKINSGEGDRLHGGRFRFRARGEAGELIEAFSLAVGVDEVGCVKEGTWVVLRCFVLRWTREYRRAREKEWVPLPAGTSTVGVYRVDLAT